MVPLRRSMKSQLGALVVSRLAITCSITGTRSLFGFLVVSMKVGWMAMFLI